MEQKVKKVLMLSAVLAVQLLSSGCLFGGSGGKRPAGHAG